MKLRLLILVLMFFSNLTWAKEKELAARSLDRRALMSVAFPDGGKPVVLIVNDVSYDVNPVNVIKFDATHAALITVNEQENGSHSRDFLIGAYFFTLKHGAWYLTKRVDSAVELGGEFFSNPKVESWPGHGYVFSVQLGGCWTGYCPTDVAFLELLPNEARFLGGQIDLSAKDLGITVPLVRRKNPDSSKDVTCEDVLSPGFQPQKYKVRDDNNINDYRCYSVSGTWVFRGDELVMSYQGEMQRFTARGKILPRQKIDTEVIYKLKNGKLVLSKGQSPVPHE